MLIGLRKVLRRVLPLGLRQRVARLRRALRDRLSGTHARLARGRGMEEGWHCTVLVEQPIRQSPLWEGKLTNLKLGCAVLDGVRVEPGEVLSFWAVLGQPSAGRGFAIGRAIREDTAIGDTGGGLCQLSGIAYELGLRGGLTIGERHAHSRDLYQSEEERFAPLGLDATVVWPWRDLRLENRLGVPVVLRFAVDGMTLKARLMAATELPEFPLDILRSDHACEREVSVSRGGKVVSADSYTF